MATTIPPPMIPPPALDADGSVVAMDVSLQVPRHRGDMSGGVAFLVSMISHLGLILVLALLFLVDDRVGTGGNFIVSVLPTSESNGTEEFEINSSSANEESQGSESIADMGALSLLEGIKDSKEPQLFEPVTVTSAKPIASDLLATVINSAAIGSSSNAFKGMGVDSRKGTNRKEAVGKRGGTPGSEQAVETALAWFAAHQGADGGWSLHFQDLPCQGQCGNPSDHLDPERAAATGLALLCYLGAGYTHQEGPYQNQVRGGLYFLMQIMQRNQHGGRFPEQTAKFAMYEQGIATLALCEAYQMTKDEALKDCGQLGINYIHYAQSVDGGWGYDPRLPGDISIACWQIMAMKSALGGGLQVPIDSIKVFDKFLDGCQADGGKLYRYRQLAPQPGPTAMGLLMRMYRGWNQTEPRLLRGMEYLLRQGPSKDDVYYNYYATQVFFQQESSMWDRWNPLMRDYLIQTQSQAGHEKGSWFFPDNRHNEIGGRLYCTAMCCMTLEVYYRHMPIYGPIKVENFEL